MSADPAGQSETHLTGHAIVRLLAIEHTFVNIRKR
jgi:hypothetical protein